MGAANNEEYPTLNDFAPDWASISAVVNVAGGATLTQTFDAKSYKWSSAVDEARGGGMSGGREMKRSTGIEKCEGSAEYYKSGLVALVSALADVAPMRGNQARVSLVEFNIIIFHTPPWSDVIIHEEMRRCRLLGFESSMAEGPDLEVVPVKLNPIECVWVLPNGKEVRLL